MFEVVTRNLVVSDVDSVARMEKSIFSDPWSRRVFAREAQLGDESYNRVAVDRKTGEILAYLVAWFVADELHLANIAVALSARRQGLAQRFLDEMEMEARRRAVRTIVLEVRRSNIAAQTLYKKNGFYTITVRRRYYQDNREDALVMVKPLNEAGTIPADGS